MCYFYLEKLNYFPIEILWIFYRKKERFLSLRGAGGLAKSIGMVYNLAKQ